jgi:hypothetical protein
MIFPLIQNECYCSTKKSFKKTTYNSNVLFNLPQMKHIQSGILTKMNAMILSICSLINNDENFDLYYDNIYKKNQLIILVRIKSDKIG